MGQPCPATTGVLGKIAGRSSEPSISPSNAQDHLTSHKLMMRGIAESEIPIPRAANTKLPATNRRVA
ncbi:hypothetical protein N7497_003816 [Penicillium chrysogenum]|jgi:hypothetical protein|nr:hypothetical protein N7497_003816 [Penicillium chrysogenum]